MDLTYTPEQDAFRKEARAWLEANVPSEPLPSLDTAEGFQAHREWEHVLNAGGWAMVNAGEYSRALRHLKRELWAAKDRRQR